MDVERRLLRDMIRIGRTEETLAEVRKVGAATGTKVVEVQSTFEGPY